MKLLDPFISHRCRRRAHQVCPDFEGYELEKLHWPHEDPAGAGATEEEELESFIKVRDQIRTKLGEYINEKKWAV